MDIEVHFLNVVQMTAITQQPKLTDVYLLTQSNYDDAFYFETLFV